MNVQQSQHCFCCGAGGVTRSHESFAVRRCAHLPFDAIADPACFVAVMAVLGVAVLSLNPQNNNCGCGWDGGDCCDSAANKKFCVGCECLDPDVAGAGDVKQSSSKRRER